jgi:MoaA/NifB/PqqE/SkfB family radical SAM enzyme
MSLQLSILYRGPLSSCNYACRYCPFAKHTETRQEHAADGVALSRFVEWVTQRQNDQLSILFTPWGEALIRRRYQQALIKLTSLPNIYKAAIQTNLSCKLDWVEACDKNKLALWATYHPSQISRSRFVAKCEELIQRGVRFSVGTVGLQENVAEIEALRKELPEHIYLWVNAYKRRLNYYTSELAERLEAVDPLFPINNQEHPSRGKLCQTGHTVISVDGEGVVRRCHFIKKPLGNIYEAGFEEILRPRSCTNATCGCHIGYVHLPELGLYERFGQGVLERILRTPQV